MKGLAADCRHAVQIYARTPGASLVAILVLAVGIAFIGAFLSLYVDLVLRPHPGYEDSGRIATIGQNTGTDLTGITYEAVRRIDEEMTSIEAAAMYNAGAVAVGSDQERVTASMVSEGFFSGIRPRLEFGQGFPDEAHAADAEPVVVLAYDFWRDRFGGDRGVVGTFIEISRPSNEVVLMEGAPPPRGGAVAETDDGPTSAQFRIVGVLADSPRNLVPFQATSSFEPALWLPLERAYPLLRGDSSNLLRLGTGGTLVRRGAGASVATVANELRMRFGDEPELWNGRPGTELDAIAGVVSNSVTHKEAKRQLELFLAASVLLALVAAANVSLFLLARAPGRRRELGIRLAVGAPLRRVARQLATESGLLVVAAAVLGLVGSIWLSLYLRGLAFLQQAEWRDISLLDWRVVALACLILLPLTLFVSLAPILGLRRVAIGAASRQLAARASMAQRLAGNTQIAVAGLFGGAAMAFGWYLGSMLLANPGFEIRDRYFMQSFAQFGQVADERAALLARASVQLDLTRWRDAVETIPGVSAVAFGGPVPGTGSASASVRIPDPADPGREIEIQVGALERQFIDLLGLRVIYGRAPERDETEFLLVNQALAEALWGRPDVVGERLPGNSRWGNAGAEVMGVLEDLSFGHPGEPARPYAFVANTNYSSAVIETELSGAELQQALTEIDSSDFNMLVGGLRPLASMRNELIAPDRARGLLTIAAATLVILLASFGFYGTQRYLVAAGRREYAIRTALGAGPRALGRLVVVRGFLLGLPGLVIGVLLAFITVAWLRGDFVSPEVSPGLVTLGVAAGLLLLLTAASLGPARLARRTQPALLLRED